MVRPSALLLCLAFVPALVLSGCACWRSPASGDDDFGLVGDFSLLERSGRTVARSDLVGKVWVASFVFTRCAGPCSQITANMARLQKQLDDQEGVLLVTFTVDPEHDTPKVLQDYAARFGADPSRWLFLTGKQDDVYGLIRTGFHLPVEQNEGTARTPGNEVMHKTKLAVVDRRGHVRGYFDGRQVDEQGQPVDDLPKLRQKIETLLRDKP